MIFRYVLLNRIARSYIFVRLNFINAINSQVRNESLEEQLKLSRRINEGVGPNTFRPPLTAGSYTFRREKEHLLGIIQDLRNK